MPKGYIVGTITITDRDAYKPYMENTGRIVADMAGVLSSGVAPWTC